MIFLNNLENKHSLLLINAVIRSDVWSLDLCILTEYENISGFFGCNFRGSNR